MKTISIKQTKEIFLLLSREFKKAPTLIGVGAYIYNHRLNVFADRLGTPLPIALTENLTKYTVDLSDIMFEFKHDKITLGVAVKRSNIRLNTMISKYNFR